MSRNRFWVMLAATALLAIGLAAPPASGAHAAAALPTCTPDTTDFHADSCAVTALTDHSVAMTWTTTPVNPFCSGGASDGCIFQFFATFGVSLAGGPIDKDDTVNGSCPDAASNQNFSFPNVNTSGPGSVGGSDDMAVANADALTCGIVFTWDADTQFPLNTAINMTEGNGQGNLETPDEDHSFGAVFETPGPHADFAVEADRDDPGAFTFTDRSFSVVPHATITAEKWTSTDGGDGEHRIWTHTFDKDGTYDVTLKVTDSSDKIDEITKQVTVTTAGSSGSSASIEVREVLKPAADTGRFDLDVGAKTVKAKAGNNDHGVAHVKAGSHIVSQIATTVGLTHYGVALACTKNGKRYLTATASGVSVKVSGGDSVVCTFTDTRGAKEHCDVPQLAGTSLAAAKAMLKKAHCVAGKVSKPKHPTKGATLVVGRSSPAAYAVRAKNAKVGLTLVVKT
jgi:PKD domain